MEREILTVMPSVFVLIVISALSGIGITVLRKPVHRWLLGVAMALEVAMAAALILLVVVPL